MKKESLSNLGFAENPDDIPTYTRVVNDRVGKKEKEGFISGLGVAGSNNNNKGIFNTIFGSSKSNSGPHG